MLHALTAVAAMSSVPTGESLPFMIGGRLSYQLNAAERFVDSSIASEHDYAFNQKLDHFDRSSKDV